MTDLRELEQPSSTDEPAARLPASPLWDVPAVVVSLVTSTVLIVRSTTTLNGHRAYLLFDDAAISLTYARNLATGHGLVWMAGQHPVEGYSNLLWTLWMTVIELTKPSDAMVGLWVMLSGAVLLAATVYVITRIARRLAPGSRAAPLLSGLAVACYYSLDSWTLVGMETGLMALLLSGAVLCALRVCDRNQPAPRDDVLSLGAGVLLALAVLTRDDGLIVAVAVAGFVVLRSRQRLKATALVGTPVLVAEVGHLAYRLATYGYPAPNTYYLKIAGIPLTTRVDRGFVVIAQNVSMQLVVPLVLAAAYFVLVRRNGGRAVPGSGLLLTIVGLQSLYVIYVGGDSYDTTFSDRLLVPVAPFLFVLAVLGAIEMATNLGSARSSEAWNRPLVVAGAVVVLGGALVLTSWLPVDQLQEYAAGQSSQITWWGWITVVAGLGIVTLGVAAPRRRPPGAVAIGGLVIVALICINAVPISIWTSQNTWASNYEQYFARYGVALAASTSPKTTIALSSVGNMTYFDHRPSVDLLGYSDHVVATTAPHTGRPFYPGHDKWDYAYSIGRLRPGVIVGLYAPTITDLHNLETWGYVSFLPPNAEAIYYLPGSFAPSTFAESLAAAAAAAAAR